MKTYYVTIDCQGQTEIVIKVQARSEDDAKYKAMLAYLSDRDVDVVSKETAQACEEDGITVIDEDGCEINLEEEEE